MLYRAKNGKLPIDQTDLNYIRFGSGERVLVMLPGLGDGLKTVAGMALPMAWMYRLFARDFTVYLFSRRNDLAQQKTTRQMAEDVAWAMEFLGVDRADVMGVSMGGMIAQWLAIDWPEKVNRLILTVTSAGPNPILLEALQEWTEAARKGDHLTLMDSNLRRIYSENYYRQNRWALPLVAALTKPKSYDRFLTLADACRTHDTRVDLGRIQSPTLVIGGERDLSLGADASRELAGAIPGAELLIYPQWGHGLYEEEKDFNRVVLEYLRG